MSKMKKLLASALAMTMVLGTTVTTFADTPDTPKETDKKAVTVTNVDAGDTMTAYQLIDAEYNENGFIGYVWADGMTNEGTKVVDPEAEITSDMVTALAANTSGLTKVENLVSGETALPVGTWMIIVTPGTDAAKVYNPMVVSVYYSTDLSGSSNYPVAGSVDADTNWILATKNAFAKSSEIKITKTVDDEEAEVANDTVNFTVETVMPSYAEATYEEVTYKVTDTIEKGLAYTEDEPVVTVGGTTVTKDVDYTLTKDEKSFTIDFKDEFVFAQAGKTEEERTVVVTYSATLTEDAITEVGINKVEVEYTNKPGETTGKKEATEKVYTFQLKNVLQKVDGDEAGLAGAEFTLYRAYDEETGELSDVFGTYTTKAEDNFDIKFEGLDADETYYLKETAAPAGYSLNEKVYTITFGNLNYDNDGDLTSYDVLVDGVTEATISYGEGAKDFGVHVVNTKLASLPSTGGVGTTIFTIAGCAIMIAAAGLFFSNRKKNA